MTHKTDSIPGVISAKAITYEGLGGPEVIKIIDRSVRAPEAGEVRIRVMAAGVNPTDELLRKIANPMVHFPVIPGADAAGIIESVGLGVARLKIGDEVMAVLTAYRADGGAQASYIVVPAASVVTIPPSTKLKTTKGPFCFLKYAKISNFYHANGERYGEHI